MIFAGVRDKQIAFLKVKVYAVALYAEAGITTPLASWKGKKAAELANDDGMFKALAEGLSYLPSYNFFLKGLSLSPLSSWIQLT